MMMTVVSRTSLLTARPHGTRKRGTAITVRLELMVVFIELVGQILMKSLKKLDYFFSCKGRTDGACMLLGLMKENGKQMGADFSCL